MACAAFSPGLSFGGKVGFRWSVQDFSSWFLLRSTTAFSYSTSLGSFLDSFPCVCVCVCMNLGHRGCPGLGVHIPFPHLVGGQASSVVSQGPRRSSEGFGETAVFRWNNQISVKDWNACYGLVVGLLCLWGTCKEKGEKHSTEACVYYNFAFAKIKKSPLHIYLSECLHCFQKEIQVSSNLLELCSVLNPRLVIYWMCDI